MLATIFALLLLADPSPKWHTDYNAAHAEAKATGKPLVLFLTTQNCVWCKRMESGPLTDPVVKGHLARCVCVKLDGSHPVAKSLNVKLYPTLVMAKWDGKEFVEKARVTGCPDAQTLRAKLRDAP